jgi:phosphate transport system substrate-binding protein
LLPHSKPVRLASVAALALALAACTGPATPNAAPTGAPTAAPTGGSSTAPSAAPTGAAVSGEIFVSGSSTVYPISQAVSEDFSAANPDFGFVVEGPGTGDGFALFCAGETDVSDASRPIKESEAQLCADNGVEFVELKVAYDGMAVMTHPDTPIECLTFADLYALFGPESDQITTWTDAGALAAEMGSTTEFPDLPLQITAPGEESGTYDSFIEIALAGLAEERGQEDVLRVPGPNYTASANDNVIVEGVESGPGSLGFVGYAYFAEAGDQVKAVPVDGGDGCIAPSPETISDGSYPLSRPLFIYPNTDKALDNAALAAWVDFYLADEGIQNATEVGYVPLPADELEATRSAWANR